MSSFAAETNIQNDFQSLSQKVGAQLLNSDRMFDFQIILFQAMPTEDGVSNEIRDMWKTIATDSSIPPLQTMPGILSQTELVS